MPLASASATYATEQTCPNCRNQFPTKRVFSKKIVLEKMDSDGCSWYKNINPYYYDIAVCSWCGYAFGKNINVKIELARLPALVEYFSHFQDFHAYEGERDLEAGSEAYQLAYEIAVKTQALRAEQGLLMRRLAWLYRTSRMPLSEKRCNKIAYHHLVYSYSYENFESVGPTETVLLWMLFELCVRLGYHEEAKLWYARFWRMPQKPALLEKRARQAWEDFTGAW